MQSQPKENIEISVPCSNHANRMIDYLCVNRDCDDRRVYCTTCLFKKEYCRHDDYIRDLREFLDEQRSQFENKGLHSCTKVNDFVGQKSKVISEYNTILRRQLDIIDDQFDKMLQLVTKSLGEARNSLKNQVEEYQVIFKKSFDLLENKINANFNANFGFSKFKSFKEMIDNYTPFSKESLFEMFDLILPNYFEQFKVPDDILNCYNHLQALKNETPYFAQKEFENIKGYFNIFKDKIMQNVPSLIDVPTNNNDQSHSPKPKTGNYGSPQRKVRNQSPLLKSGAELVIDDANPLGYGKNNQKIDIKKITLSSSFDTKHKRTVFSLAYLNNRLLATASDDSTIKVFDILSFQCIKTLVGHTAGVRALAVLANGNLVSASWDKTLKIWNTVNLNQPKDSLDNMAQQLFKAGLQNDVLKTLTGHSNAVASVEVLSDGKLIASGSTDASLKLWNSEDGSCIRTWTGHIGEVLCIGVKKSEKVIVTGSSDRTLKIWSCDRKHNSCLKTLFGHTGMVWALIILSDDVTIVSGGLDKLVKVWSIDTGDCFHTLSGHTNQILCLKEYKGRTVVSGDFDGNIKLWETGDWTLAHAVKYTKGSVYTLALTEDHMILTSGADKQLCIWN